MNNNQKTATKQSKSAKKVKEELHMVSDPEGWFDGTKIIPYTGMSQEHLQRAKLHAQRKELFYYNRMQVFSDLVIKLDDEAVKRGITLRDHNTEFHKNTRKLKSSAVKS